MADPRDVPRPSSWTPREVIALVLVLLGTGAVIAGAALYDPRAAVVTAGTLALVLGVLLGLGQ